MDPRIDKKVLSLCMYLIFAATLPCLKLLKHTNMCAKAVTESQYDRYLFATEWAGTACKFNKCNQKIADGHFNVHGLWPSTNGDSPQECDTLYFDESNLSPYLKQNLYNYWNGCYKDSWDFIKYELKKHGTCWNLDFGNPAQMDQGIFKILQAYNPNDEFSRLNTYMTIVLFLSTKMDPYKVLKSIGVEPGDGQKFMIDKFLDVFNKSFNTSTARYQKPRKSANPRNMR